MTSAYDPTLIGDGSYNMPRAYTLEANAAPGSASPPGTGWVTLATVTGNTYHSRQHHVNLAGYNWLRMNITAANGAAGNSDAALNLDVHDASQGVQDDWIFFGDSIPSAAMSHDLRTAAGGTCTFSQLINASIPNHFPVQESGAIGGMTSSDGARYLNAWLGVFPGQFV